MPISPWRLALQPASFRGALFHIDVHARSSGRRPAIHEFPKRDIPYTEDMGKKIKVWHVTGYLIGPDYEDQRDNLIAALEAAGPGSLVHPTYPDADQVICGPYSATEYREKGGWVAFEMTFFDAGQSVTQQLQPDTQSTSSNTINGAVPSATQTPGASSNALVAADFSQSSDISAIT